MIETPGYIEPDLQGRKQLLHPQREGRVTVNRRQGCTDAGRQSPGHDVLGERGPSVPEVLLQLGTDYDAWAAVGGICLQPGPSNGRGICGVHLRELIGCDSTWAIMLVGLGAMGFMMRKRRKGAIPISHFIAREQGSAGQRRPRDGDVLYMAAVAKR